jgi:DNA-binding MarR family transcriptional regulator
MSHGPGQDKSHRSERGRPHGAGSEGPHRPRPTHKERTLRAFRAYLDLLDAAEWMGGRMRGQLEAFDLTMGGFRVLEMLYRDGPMVKRTACERLQCTRQNVDAIVERLEESGWVRREIVWLPPAEIKESHLSKAQRGLPRRGPRVGVVSLTPLGEKFIGVVFPRHGKMVKALMRALDGREQEALSRMCRKLKEGDVMKYVKEMRMADPAEEESGE